ncbi:MAG: DMT family transporter [Bacillota bacterium]
MRLLTKKEWKYVIVGGLLNVVAHHYFLSLGLMQTSASNSGLILGMGPLLTMILAILFWGDVMTFPKVIGSLLGFLGVTVIILKNNVGIDGISVGDVYVFFSILAQVVSFVLIHKVAKTLDPRLMTGYMLLIGSVFLFIISLLLAKRIRKYDTRYYYGMGSFLFIRYLRYSFRSYAV